MLQLHDYNCYLATTTTTVAPATTTTTVAPATTTTTVAPATTDYPTVAPATTTTTVGQNDFVDLSPPVVSITLSTTSVDVTSISQVIPVSAYISDESDIQYIPIYMRTMDQNSFLVRLVVLHCLLLLKHTVAQSPYNLQKLEYSIRELEVEMLLEMVWVLG